MTRDQIREGASSGTQAEITDMQVKRAEEQAKLDEMEESLRNLTGQIEIVQNQLRMMEAQKMAAAGQASEGEEKPMSAAEVKQKFLLFEEALRSMELRLNTLTEELKKVKAAPRAASRKAAPKKELGNYAGAQKDFDKKSWKKAIVGYEKYRELNPKGKRYADATYKIGVCFQELGMKSEAKAFYEEVVAKFPKSNTSNKAKYRLSKLK